jgi:hypothetical protein
LRERVFRKGDDDPILAPLAVSVLGIFYLRWV